MAPREAEKHKKFDKFFDEFIATQQFASLDLMPGSEEGLEYVTTQLKTLKSMTKEENAEKKSKKQNNTQVNATNNAAVAPAETEVKPRKPITRSSTSATRARLAKLLEDDKLKRLAEQQSKFLNS
jgi:hypothetical protein